MFVPKRVTPHELESEHVEDLECDSSAYAVSRSDEQLHLV